MTDLEKGCFKAFKSDEQEAAAAFDFAIKMNVLSKDHTAKNYAGNYMFMGRYSSGWAFKNIETRQYVHCMSMAAA
jgi:hypothetical protein